MRLATEDEGQWTSFDIHTSPTAAQRQKEGKKINSSVYTHNQRSKSGWSYMSGGRQLNRWRLGLSLFGYDLMEYSGVKWLKKQLTEKISHEEFNWNLNSTWNQMNKFKGVSSPKTKVNPDHWCDRTKSDMYPITQKEFRNKRRGKMGWLRPYSTRS